MTATQVKQIRIGPYTAGEIPAPFTYQFLQNDGVTPVDLSLGFTAKFNLGTSDANATTRVAAVTDGANGKVTYVWVAGDLPRSGSYVAQFWAGNGTVRYGSALLVFNVSEAAGTAPTI